MRAVLFFKMLSRGRARARRERMSHYYELCRCATYPTMTQDSKNALLEYYYDSSLTPEDIEARESLRQEMESRAAETYATPTQAQDFFRATAGKRA